MHKLQIPENKIILEIGIGLGVMTKELCSTNNQVIACDISQDAFIKVKPFVKSTYETINLKYIEPVDLAICHLVFQHNDDTEIERIINDVNLKEGGVFSVQFAYIRENDIPNNKLKEFMERKTHYFRDISTMKQIVEKTNKKILNILEPIHYYADENCSWYIVHIINKS